jgi:transposase
MCIQTIKRPLGAWQEWIMKGKEKGMGNSEMARHLEVTEGAVRYQARMVREGWVDGRSRKPSRLDPLAGVIRQWVKDQEGKLHRLTLKALEAMLRAHHGWRGSYDSVHHYVRRHFPEFLQRPVRVRVETPPGKLVQVDWKESVRIQLGVPGNWVLLHAFVFLLAFSRKVVVVWSFGKDLGNWLRAHREALKKLGGVPEAVRCDCLKTAIVEWHGERSKLNESYRRDLEALKMLPLPARPGRPEDKGKVEKKIRDLFGRLDLEQRIWADAAELDRETDTAVKELERVWRCGATGLTVAESFAFERHHLRPLPPGLPDYPVREERRPVERDGTVLFMGNRHQVDREHAGRRVLCTFTGSEILMHHDGEEIGRWPHLPGTQGMVRLQAGVLDDPKLHFNPTVRAWAMEAARRQVDYYQAIIERRDHHDVGAR